MVKSGEPGGCGIPISFAQAINSPQSQKTCSSLTGKGVSSSSNQQYYPTGNIVYFPEIHKHLILFLFSPVVLNLSKYRVGTGAKIGFQQKISLFRLAKQYLKYLKGLIRNGEAIKG
jgi:hypothetical protein